MAVYREHSYTHKLDAHPDEVYKIMLENQTKNRDYVPESSHIKVRTWFLFGL